MTWATIEQLEDHLGLTSDDAMVDALYASLAWCTRQRPDLDPGADYSPPTPVNAPQPYDTSLAVGADVNRAVIIYAGLLYRERSTPQGFATYDAVDNTFTDQSAMMNVYRLLGTRRPVAR